MKKQNEKSLFIVTNNIGKLMAANNVFSKFGIKVKQIKKEYPEIQAEKSIEIAKFTAIKACKEFNAPVVREDHSLFINFLNIPGPYTSYIEKRISVNKLLEILKNQKDRGGYFEIAAALALPEGFIKEFEFRVPILFAKKPKGSLSGGWNRILKLPGSKKTFAEQKEEENLNIWNKNYIAIAKYLLKYYGKNKINSINRNTGRRKNLFT